MADKLSVADWNTNPELNDNVGGTSVAEGCAPSNINNSIRKMMAQLKSNDDAVRGIMAKKATVSAAAPSGGVDGDVWYQI